MKVWVVYDHSSDSLGGSYACVYSVWSSREAAEAYVAANRSAWFHYEVSDELEVQN